jgi:hypothetical protein
VEQRKRAEGQADFVMYSDELFCYGLYKLGGDNFSNNYAQVYKALDKATNDEKSIYRSRGLTYGHEAYFKSAKSHYDLDRLLDFVPGILSV